VFEFVNVLDTNTGAYVVNGAYSGTGHSSESPTRDHAVAVIAELLHGNTAAIRRSAADASTAVSIVQTFAHVIDTLAGKLATMQELARKASSPDYSRVQVEEMQNRFRNLAEEINQAVNCTEYDWNKPFTAGGRSVSIPVGDGSKIDIFARDCRFEAEGLNIVSNARGALSKVEHAIANVAEYRSYLGKQLARLDDFTAVIESEGESAARVNQADFQPDLALERARCAAGLISQDKSASLDTQANLAPGEALKLLSENS